MVFKIFWTVVRAPDISLQGGKSVKNLEIFWMNNQTIIEFGFQMIWKIIPPLQPCMDYDPWSA